MKRALDLVSENLIVNSDSNHMVLEKQLSTHNLDLSEIIFKQKVIHSFKWYLLRIISIGMGIMIRMNKA